MNPATDPRATTCDPPLGKLTPGGFRRLSSKYDIETVAREDCVFCKLPIWITNAYWEVLGPFCEGCFGWPVCQCKTTHTGPCISSP